MIVDDLRGPVAIHGFTDGVYVVTAGGAWPIRGEPELERRLAAICRQYFDDASGKDRPRKPHAEFPIAGEFFRSDPCGVVSYVGPRGGHRLTEEPELARMLAAECRHALPLLYSADPWELD